MKKHEVIENKIESLRRCLVRIQAKTPKKFQDFENSFDLQDIVLLNLERAIQTSVDIAAAVLSHLESPIPDTMKQCFDVLFKKKIISKKTAEKMGKSVGFRNVAVHEYDTLDLKIVFDIASQHLKDFKLFIKEISRFIS